MAASITLQQLKAIRTSAKRQFSRLANNVTRMHTLMSEEELKDSFTKLTLETNKVIEANDDVEAQYMAENESERNEEALDEAQKADLEKTATECEKKLKELKDLIQSTLWANYGEDELTLAVQTAETEAERVMTIEPSEDKEAFDFMVEHLKSMVETAKKSQIKWKCWAPPAEHKEFHGRIRELEVILPKLTSRKADFIRAKARKESSRLMDASLVNYSTPIIRLKPASLPKFTGVRREFYRWRRDWESLQAQGEPSGSREIKKFQLIDSIDEKVIKDLRLSSHNTADDIFRVMENRFGNKTSIAIEIVEEIQSTPVIRSHQPKKIIELIQTVEKALSDLSDLDEVGAIKNPLVIRSIESKLPDVLKKEWLLHAAEKGNALTQARRFDYLLTFLKSQEVIYEQLDQLSDEPPKSRPEQRQARTRASNQASSQSLGCVVCGEGGHRRKLYFCRKFRVLKLSEKKDAVRKLGGCKRCLEVHSDCDGCSKTEFICKDPSCKGSSGHHIYLCPNREKAKHGTVGGGNNRKSYTEAQEEFVQKLPPELAQQCRHVFSNTASRNVQISSRRNLLEEYGIAEWPVIMMLLEVTANAGQKVGTLIDLASDTNYITHKAAKRLKLRSEAITLVVHGVGGMEVTVKTMRYLLKIRVRNDKSTYNSHQLVCYGLDDIADIHHPVTAKQLQKFFPDIPLFELQRPKEVDLLISHKEGRLAPQRVSMVGDLVLWDGPLGKTVAGSHPELSEQTTISAHASQTHFARSMRTAAVNYKELTHSSPTIKHSYATTTAQDFLNWWKWDSIGAACNPKCGGCRCGNCQPGGKDMTLAEERELEVVKSGLTYISADEHSENPHWHASYPWLDDPSTLPNNRRGVEATFLRTERKLAKEPLWKAAYTVQIHEMVDRRAAKKLSREELLTWTGPLWYISHLIAPNPHSVTTPVRLVWNSSQKYQGQSLNDHLLKGPDVLNLIRVVLLKFRQGSYAALGDISKMYNSVWLEEKEVHLHRFLWRDSKDE
ncbi:uncharacterized protein LOC114481263 [Gouania willdenowi]|uniref:uncharacterized protein LOC114481263 n=1 Tax=Gouania willdenowi TaxID=441366 RepID=UPI001056BB78|nr:uncharacterized protein LOC114481263 [Gouania willdenowi]